MSAWWGSRLSPRTGNRHEGLERILFLGSNPARTRKPSFRGLRKPLRPVYPRAYGGSLTQVDLSGYADHPPRRGDASPLRPAGRDLIPARQREDDGVHDEHGDECEQNHE